MTACSQPHSRRACLNATLLRLPHAAPPAGGTSLREVFAAVDEARAAGGAASPAAAALAYVLVQAQPRVVLGAAEEDKTLAEAGVVARSALAVVPNAAAGHLPPQPAAAEAAADGEAPVKEQQQQQQHEDVGQNGDAEMTDAAAPASAPAAVPAAPRPPEPERCDIQVRLSDGGARLQRSFDSRAPLGVVFDWIDAERTDGWWVVLPSEAGGDSTAFKVLE